MKNRVIILWIIGLLLLGACQPAPAPQEGKMQALVLDESPDSLLLLMDAKAPGKGANNLTDLCTMPVREMPAEMQVDTGGLLTFKVETMAESFPCQLLADDFTVVSTPAQLTSHVYAANINNAIALQQFGYGILIDVRTPEEYQTGHLPGALLLPVDQIAQEIQSVVPDKDTPVMVYCRSGNRSATAAKALDKLGYTVIFDLGGIKDFTGAAVTGTEPGTP
ncbi:MAG TPA: rhodanese-like domain-containing protein [Bellilinea sp.]|nr:rhodanese-like domain-containing protein [Bellilinea sp.]